MARVKNATLVVLRLAVRNCAIITIMERFTSLHQIDPLLLGSALTYEYADNDLFVLFQDGKEIGTLSGLQNLGEKIWRIRVEEFKHLYQSRESQELAQQLYNIKISGDLDPDVNDIADMEHVALLELLSERKRSAE